MAVALRTRRPRGQQTSQTSPGGPRAGGPQEHSPAAPPAKEDWHRWVILVGLITAAVLEVMDTTIVNVALPRMSGNFGATPDEIAWVSTGYILSNVVVLPMTAWLSVRIGAQALPVRLHRRLRSGVVPVRPLAQPG